MRRRNVKRQWTLFLTGFLCLAAMVSPARPAKADLFSTINLVSDDPIGHPARLTDSNLVNAWGVSYSPSSPFWVSNNGTGTATLYNVNPVTDLPTKLGLTVNIPGNGTVTGQAFNAAAGTGAFNGDNFLFVSEDGTISGWRGALGTTAEVLQLGDPSNVYKGTTLVTTGGNSYLLAANFLTGNIDVLKGNGGAPSLGGNFVDPTIPSGFAPFNIQNIGGKIYVTYAKQAPGGHDDMPGVGNGFVSTFDLNGNFLGRVASMGTLNSPWGLAFAPSTFGVFAGDLLVGNFGDGRINAFDPTTNAFLGQLQQFPGTPLSIDGLWTLTVGNNGGAGSSSKLYFSAGPSDESHGLFGILQPTTPEPTSLALLLLGSVGALVIGRRRFAAG
jgi:uncharacterized protein (TIGR03118 family)